MGRGAEQIFSQRSCTDGQQAHEKMLNVHNYQGNANQNHNEIPYHNHIWLDDNKCCGEWGAIRTLIHCCG